MIFASATDVTLIYKKARVFLFLPTMFRAFLDLLFPRYCLACHGALARGEETVCLACRQNLPFTESHVCPNETLNQKFWGRIPLASVQAYLTFTKGGNVQRLLHALKYKNHPEVGDLLGRWYGNELREVGLHERLDLLVPVPLHPKKQKVRGYNQSDCFARGLSEALGVEWSSEVLKKAKNTTTQTRMTRSERLKNVESAFFVENPALIAGKRLGLVDDVVTTGATLEACAETLLACGCSELHLITIATAI